MLAQDINPPGTGGSPNLLRVNYLNVTTGIDLFLNIESSIAFGDSFRNLVQPEGIQSRLLFTSDTCTPVAGLYAPLPDCSTFYYGIMNDGIHGASLAAGSLMRDSLIDVLSTNLTDYYSVNQTFQGHLAEVSYFLDTHYNLANAYYRVVTLSSGIDNFESLFSFRVSLFIAFVIWSFLIFVFYFRPLIWDLNSEQKRTITFLLLIPAYVMDKMKSLRNFVQKMAADEMENNME